MLERLQKILSAQGIASRRKAEEYIERGLVKVNGNVATLGDKADPETDVIEVDGAVLAERKDLLYYVMNKPVGVETSNVDRTDDTKTDRAPIVRDLLPKELQGVIYPVGRLDKDSHGLLLFTNDGVLAYRLTHPKFTHEKEYEVTVDRPILVGVLRKLAEGVTIKGVQTKPAKTRKIDACTFRITLTEGRNRQIRRMCQKLGFTVKDLQRVRIVSLTDPALKEGKIRELKKEECNELLKAVGISNK